jgi:hypothetical protein
MSRSPFFPRLIGIAGAAGVGKDSLARAISVAHGHQICSFADPIRKLFFDRFNLDPALWNDRKWKEAPNLRLGMHRRGGTGSLVPFSPRSWVQWVGTDFGRQIGDPDIWVRKLMRTWHDIDSNGGGRLVVPDVRYDNEAAAILSQGGYVLEIIDRKAAPVNPHESERGISERYVHGRVVDAPDVASLYREAVKLLEQA